MDIVSEAAAAQEQDPMLHHDPWARVRPAAGSGDASEATTKMRKIQLQDRLQQNPGGDEGALPEAASAATLGCPLSLSAVLKRKEKNGGRKGERQDGAIPPRRSQEVGVHLPTTGVEGKGGGRPSNSGPRLQSDFEVGKVVVVGSFRPRTRYQAAFGGMPCGVPAPWFRPG